MPLPLAAFPIAQATGTRQFIDNLARTPLSHVVILLVVLTCIRVAIHPILTRTAPHKRFGSYVFLRGANEVLDAVIYAEEDLLDAEGVILPTEDEDEAHEADELVSEFRDFIEGISPEDFG